MRNERSSRRSAKAAKAERRFAWWLVQAYPPRFRRTLGLSLVDTLDDRMRARRAAGAPAAGVWLAALGDTVWNATAEWVRALRDVVREVRLKPDATYDPVRRRTMIDKLRQDVRYALRLWARKPGVALVAVLTLALGIGANTAMFSIVNAVLLRPLPFADADRLVAVWGRTPKNPRTLVSLDEYQAFRTQTDTFEAVATWLGQSVNLTGGSEPQRITGNFVSGTFFDVLQLKAEHGRLFQEQDVALGSAKPVVVISHQFWETHFQSNPSAIGATLTLNGAPLTVIGVLAPPFDPRTVPSGGYFVNYDVYLPLGLFPVPPNVPRAVLNASPSILGIARLRSGVPLALATANLDVVMQRLDAANPAGRTGRSGLLVAAQDDVVGSSRASLLLLLASVGVVLLIACVNVSNLLVARAVDRQKEMAVRAALGAGRLAVFRQLSVEAALLSIVSSLAGFGLGRWALRGLQALPPPSVPIPDNIPLDGSVLAFTIAVAMVVAVACGFAPALKISRPDLSRALQAGGRRASGGAARTRDTLVVAEIALSAALLAVAALLIQSMFALQRVDVGFDSANVFTLQFRLPVSKYRTPEDIARFFTQSIERVRAVPGVESAALARRVPFSGNWGDTPFTREEQTVPKGSEPRAIQNIVSPDYFKAMRIPMLQGRDFTDRDDLTAPPVVVVNQALARTTWPDADPIGRRIRVPEFTEPVTVIGVVGNVKHRTATEPVQPQLYLAHYQTPMIFSSLVARTAVPPLSITGAIRQAIWTVDRDQPLWSISPLDQIVAASHGSAKFTALLLAILAAVAVVLACVGIYGVMSYAVTERTHEIGIRMALGASADRVMREIVWRGLRLTTIALVVGVPAAVGIGRLARGVLFGVGPGDPATLGGAAALIAIVAVAACYLPARRAARVDPVVALAQE
jgi:putative ABC transport system permease protein